MKTHLIRRNGKLGCNKDNKHLNLITFTPKEFKQRMETDIDNCCQHCVDFYNRMAKEAKMRGGN